MNRVITAVLAIGLATAFGAVRADASMENPSLGEYYHLGEYYLNTRQYAQAITNYTAMIARHADTKEAERGWLSIGGGYCQLMQQAMSDLERAKAAGAPKSEIEGLQSKVTSQMNQSIAAYRKAAAQFPAARAEASIGLGELYAARGQEKMEEAKTELKRVIDNYPEEAGRAQIVLGDVALAAGDRAAAKQAYTAARTSFPEVASLATLKYAAMVFDDGSLGEAADVYTSLIDSEGVDGAYSGKYQLLDTVMQEAVEKRAAVIRALEIKDAEIEGLTSVVTRFYGTNVGLDASLKKAEALSYHGKADEAVSLLNSVVTQYPKSVWAVRALMRLAKIHGATPQAADAWGRVISSWPQSLFLNEAKMSLAGTFLTMAEAEKEEGRRIELRTRAGNVCREIITASPSCPEGSKAREFLASRGL